MRFRLLIWLLVGRVVMVSAGNGVAGSHSSKRAALLDDMSLSPEFQKEYEAEIGQAKSYLHPETGLRYNQKAKKVRVKNRIPSYKLLASKTTTVGDFKALQRVFLSYGIPLSAVFSNAERRDLIKTIKSREKEDSVTPKQKRIMYQNHAVKLGIASKEWFDNQTKVTNQMRGSNLRSINKARSLLKRKSFYQQQLDKGSTSRSSRSRTRNKDQKHGKSSPSQVEVDNFSEEIVDLLRPVQLPKQKRTVWKLKDDPMADDLSPVEEDGEEINPKDSTFSLNRATMKRIERESLSQIKESRPRRISKPRMLDSALWSYPLITHDRKDKQKQEAVSIRKGPNKWTKRIRKGKQKLQVSVNNDGDIHDSADLDLSRTISEAPTLVHHQEQTPLSTAQDLVLNHEDEISPLIVSQSPEHNFDPHHWSELYHIPRHDSPLFGGGEEIFVPPSQHD